MDSLLINKYGDRLIPASAGHGSDIATQRADDLDLMAVEEVMQLGTPCHALDAACGLGGQAIRLAEAGARVVAADIIDFAAEVAQGAEKAGVAGRISFVKADLRSIDEVLTDRAFDLICCQRAIHYLAWHDAVSAVGRLAAILKPGGKLYLSASGIESELGVDYPGRGLALADRYAPLKEAMATKHGINGPVCLYSLHDLNELFLAAGLWPVQQFASLFGNVKGVACRPERSLA